MVEGDEVSWWSPVPGIEGPAVSDREIELQVVEVGSNRDRRGGRGRRGRRLGALVR